MQTTPAARLFAVLLVVASASAIAGCMDAGQPPSEGAYRVSGTFTENATQEEMDQMSEEVTVRGGEFAQLESFPVQFRATNLGQEECEQVRTFAQARDYVAEVGECQASNEDGGDEPTSNES